jgi:hypothetical protein
MQQVFPLVSAKPIAQAGVERVERGSSLAARKECPRDDSPSSASPKKARGLYWGNSYSVT